MEKKIFIIICVSLLLVCCKNNETQDNCSIIVTSLNDSPTDRDGKDYIRCWINDSLSFSGTYRASYDSILDDYSGVTVAELNKSDNDSIKIRIRLISLDSLLFGQKRIVDTTFFYKIDSISVIEIVSLRPFEHFDIYDPLNFPAVFEYE